MAFWDGSITPVMRKWHWKERIVWWPFLKCDRSHKSLFLKKAYYGRHYIDWEFERDMWLSAEEFMLAALKEEFNER